MKRVVCKQLASLMCLKTSTATSDSKDTLDVSVIKLESRDLTVPNDCKHLDLTASPTTAAAAAAGQSISSVERQMALITNLLETRLRTDEELRNQRDKNQQTMNEWIVAAAVIDRVCFVVFSIVLLVGSAIFYLLFLFHP